MIQALGGAARPDPQPLPLVGKATTGGVRLGECAVSVRDHGSAYTVLTVAALSQAGPIEARRSPVPACARALAPSVSGHSEPEKTESEYRAAESKSAPESRCGATGRKIRAEVE